MSLSTVNTQAKIQTNVTCPALFIAAPASGQGKTTVTAALARYFKNSGKRVTVFKTGPDYLDPQILEQASGRPVEQLDIWMAGNSYCQQKLYEAAESSDLILIEGVMGLYDGSPSAADLAARFGIPIALVMDVKGMAQTAGAVVQGLANYRDDINVIGLIANKCSTQRHTELIQEALPTNIKLLATLARDEAICLPERHLGLVQANEVQDELEHRFEAGAQALIDGGIATLESSGLFETLLPVSFQKPEATIESKLLADRPLAGKRIAIAKDAAFSFIYTANIKALESLGAECIYFSPVADQSITVADGAWFPGGYPELYAKALSENHSMIESIRSFSGPILAECGGLLYSLDSLTDLSGDSYAMTGLLPGQGAMKGKRGCQGMQTAQLPEGEIRGHAHHRSRCETDLQPIGYGKRQKHPAPGEAIYRKNNVTASYLHLFFPSNLNAIAQIFNSNGTQNIEIEKSTYAV